MSNYKNIESALIRGGIFGDPLTRSVNVPIYQTSTFQQPELGTNPKWEYARTGNPTRAARAARQVSRSPPAWRRFRRGCSCSNPATAY